MKDLAKFLKTRNGKITIFAVVILVIAYLKYDEIEAFLIEKGVITPRAVNPILGDPNRPEISNEVRNTDTSKKLTQGQRGEHVLDVQRKLKGMGYNIDVDGIYGPQTETALYEFSSRRSLTVAEFNSLYTAWLKKNGGSSNLPTAVKADRSTIRVVNPSGSPLRSNGSTQYTQRVDRSVFAGENRMVERTGTGLNGTGAMY